MAADGSSGPGPDAAATRREDRARLEDFAMTDTLNVGKPIRDTRSFDVPCAADLFESYAGLPDKIAGKMLWHAAGQRDDAVSRTDAS